MINDPLIVAMRKEAVSSPEGVKFLALEDIEGIIRAHQAEQPQDVVERVARALGEALDNMRCADGIDIEELAQAAIAAMGDVTNRKEVVESGSQNSPTQILIRRALEAGKTCCEMLIYEGGATATELNEEELPLINKAIQQIYSDQSGEIRLIDETALKAAIDFNDSIEHFGDVNAQIRDTIATYLAALPKRESGEEKWLTDLILAMQKIHNGYALGVKMTRDLIHDITTDALSSVPPQKASKTPKITKIEGRKP